MGRGKSTGGGVGGCPGCVELGDDGQGVGGGGCGIKEEVRDERGRRGEGEGIRFGAQWTPAGTPAGRHQLGRQLVDTSWDSVDTRCLAGQVNYTIDLQL